MNVYNFLKSYFALEYAEAKKYGDPETVLFLEYVQLRIEGAATPDTTQELDILKNISIDPDSIVL